MKGLYRFARGKSSPQFSQNISSDGMKPVIVDGQSLRKLETRPSLPLYIRKLYNRRHFIRVDGRARAFSMGKDLLLGKTWIVTQPLLEAAMYGVMFGLILQTSRGIDNFIGYLIIGITYFSFLTKLVNGGTGLIRNSKGLISSFSFPKAALVASLSLRYFLDALPSAVIAILIALLAQWGQPLSLTIFLTVPLFLMLHFFGTGLMFFTARITAQIPDTRVIVQLAARAWFFVSGVFFSIERFVDHPEVRMVMEANPAYIFLQAIRGSVMYQEPPTFNTWLILLAWTLGAFVLGFLFFWQAEEKYIDVK